MNTQPPKSAISSESAHAFLRLENHWNKIDSAREEIATELDSRLPVADGQLKKQLKQISRWFRKPNAQSSYEQALQRPEILAVCGPIIETQNASLATDEKLTGSEITRGISHALTTLVCYENFQRSFMRILLYPILLTIMTALFLLLFSFVVATPFEEMFDEFGIQLPALTESLFFISRTVRALWWVATPIVIGISLLAYFAGRSSHGHRWLHGDRFSEFFRSKQSRAARAAIHADLLLKAGLDNNEAVDVLSRVSPLPSPNLFKLYSLAMRQPPSRAKSALLRQVAQWYNANTRNSGDWILQWLAAAYCYLIYAIMLVVVTALFMPLVAVVSGLTGG